jgi:AbrB family looped-hinge helix DNA binding protein
MDRSTVTSKGQVTIPKAIRRQLGIRQGSRVEFALRKDKAELRVVHRAKRGAASGFGLLKARRHLPADFDIASLVRPKRRGNP